MTKILFMDLLESFVCFVKFFFGNSSIITNLFDLTCNSCYLFPNICFVSKNFNSLKTENTLLDGLVNGKLHWTKNVVSKNLKNIPLHRLAWKTRSRRRSIPSRWDWRFRKELANRRGRSGRCWRTCRATSSTASRRRLTAGVDVLSCPFDGDDDSPEKDRHYLSLNYKPFNALIVN